MNTPPNAGQILFLVLAVPWFFGNLIGGVVVLIFLINGIFALLRAEWSTVSDFMFFALIGAVAVTASFLLLFFLHRLVFGKPPRVEP